MEGGAARWEEQIVGKRLCGQIENSKLTCFSFGPRAAEQSRTNSMGSS